MTSKETGIKIFSIEEKKISTKTLTSSLSKTGEQLFLNKIFAHRIQDLYNENVQFCEGKYLFFCFHTRGRKNIMYKNNVWP